MANEWYYMIDNVKSGPVSAQKLKQLAAAKQIDDRYLLLRDGMKKWVKASNVKGLFQMQADTSQSSPPFQKSSEKDILIQDEESFKGNNSKTNKGLSFRKKHPILNFFGIIILFFFVVNIPLFPSDKGRDYKGLIDLAKEHLSHKKKENLKNDSVEELIIKSANEFNKRLPIMVGKHGRLDNVMVTPGLRLTFFMTLIDVSSSEIEQNSFREKVQTQIQESTCSSKDTMLFLKEGAQIIYRFSGSDGKFIGDIIVNPNDCS